MYTSIAKGKRESSEVYYARINALAPIHGGYAYFSPGNYQKEIGRFGIFLVWNNDVKSVLSENQPEGGYYISVRDEDEDYFLNKYAGLPVYVRLIARSGKIYPASIYLKKGSKKYPIIFNGCEVQTPEMVYFKAMEQPENPIIRSSSARKNLSGSGYKFQTSGYQISGSTKVNAFATSGYRFATTGYRLGGSGYRFATTGYQFSGTGYRFTTTGYRLSGTGYRFTTTGYKLSGTGYRFTTTGYKLSGTGYRFTTTGYNFSGSGYRFTTTGYRLSGSGIRFANSGMRNLGSAFSWGTSGYQISGSGMRFGSHPAFAYGSGLKFGTSGYHLSGSGRRMSTSGRRFRGCALPYHTFSDAFYNKDGEIYIKNEAPTSFLDMESIYGIGNLGYGLDLI